MNKVEDNVIAIDIQVFQESTSKCLISRIPFAQANRMGQRH